MKAIFKRLVASVLCALIALGAAPLASIFGVVLPEEGAFHVEAEAANVTSYSKGDIIEFGWYPQGKVTNSETIAALNSLGGEWKSYGYYSGTGSWSNGQMTAGDYMRYKDVIYGSDKYRGVIFDLYRPYYTGYTSSSGNSYQDDNGYYTGNVYWFKYEPIKWRVLDPDTGLLLSEAILDSQTYNNYILCSGTDEYGYSAYYGDEEKTYYSNNYEKSDIRDWLNRDFYCTAFSAAQQNIIQYTTLNNKAYSSSYSAYDSADTSDKIYLLSYADAFNSSYFSGSSARQAQGSAYAKCQGLWVSTSSSYYGNSYWRLRSAGDGSNFACIVGSYGGVDYSYNSSITYRGVRPALNLNLKSTIFQSDVRDTGTAYSSGKGSASVSKNKNAVTINTKQSGYNEGWFNLKNVTVTQGSKIFSEKEDEEGFFEIKKTELYGTEDIILTKDGFRKYIIPYAVFNSLKGGTRFDAYMELKDEEEANGKPYISTVFGKSAGMSEYVDLTKTELVAESDTRYEIIVNGVGLKDPTYYIAQDSSHKIESTDGHFNTKEVYSKLTTEKTVYVYAKDSDGSYTNFHSVKLKKSADDGMLEEVLKTSTYGLGGSGGVTIKIPDGNPLFGNSDISLKAFSAPLTVYYDATNGTYIGTIGFDLYNFTLQDKTVSTTLSSGAKASCTSFGEGETKKAFQNFKESFGYFNNKPFADKDKNGKKNKNKSLNDEWESFVNRCKTASKYSQEYSDSNFSADFLGYLEFTVNEQGFVVKEASLKVGADFSYSYTYQGAVWVIPAYFKTTLGASASLEGSFSRPMTDSELPFDFDITLNVEPNVAVEAGVGVEKLAKLGVEVKGSAPISVEFTKKHFKMDFKGEINLKTKAFIFSWDKKICDGELNVIDKYWGSTTAVQSTAFGVPQYISTASSEDEQALIDYYNEGTYIDGRDYLESTSPWLGDLVSSALTDVSVSTLTESVFEDGKPAVITVGDKLLMAWVEDCAERDAYNKMRLVYSIYDGISWSEPVAVFDDGKNDDLPVLATDGENVYFAWQKINTVLDENSLVTESLQQVDICTATYSLSENAITEKKVIRTGGGYDYAQAITVENGKPVIYFASCEDESVSTSFNSRINKYSGDTVSVLVTQLSYVQSIKADGDKMSYVIDTDGDLSTTNDVNAFTYAAGRSTEYDKGDLESAVVSAFYGKIGDEDVMFVTDGANIYYDLDGERKTVLKNGKKLSSLNLTEWNEKPAFVWTEENEDGSGNAVYFASYDGTAWSEPVEIYVAENYYFDALDIVNYGGDLVGGFMQDELTYNEETESYSITSVNLAAITIGDHTNLTVGCVNVEEEELFPGNTAQLCVYVENNGTQKICEVEFTLSDGIGESQTQAVDIDLAPGEGKNIYLDYVVPEGFAETTLTVTGEPEYDCDTTDNTVETKIGLPELHLVKYDYALNGDSYVIKAYVENNSLTDAEDVTAKLYIGENGGDTFYDATIEALAVGETGCVEFQVRKNALVFDDEGFTRLYCAFEDEKSKKGTTSSECVLLSNATTVCAHPETGEKERIDSTCSENGYEAGEYCLACGEYVSGGEVIEPHHTAPEEKEAVDYTCTENGYTAGVYCNDCNMWVSGHETVPAQHTGLEEKDAVDFTCTENGYTAGVYCNDCNTWVSGHTVIKPRHIDEDEDLICDICGEPELSISPGETKTIQVPKGETVYLAFKPTISGTYTFTSSSSSDTYGYLYASDRSQITYNDDGGSGNNFKITYHLDAGTKYYFGARYYSSSSSGSFPVTLTLDNCDTHENTSSLERIEATCTTDGHEAGVYCNDCEKYISGGETIAAHHTATEEKAAVDFTCTENGYTAGVYCNDCNTWVSGHEVIKAHHIDENDDSICDICSKPSELTIKAGETKTIEVQKGETVYIAFRPTASGTYTFTSSSGSDTYGYLYNADMTQITSNDDGGSGNNFKITYRLEAGSKYYFGARFYSSTTTGSFPVTLTLTTPDAPTLTPASSSVTIDTEKKLIMGVAPKTASVSDVLSVSESGYTVTASEGYYLGTGSTVTFSIGDFSYEYTVVVSSDLNGDGVVDVLDVAISERISAGHFNFDDTNDVTGAFRLAADANGDGKTDVNDYSVIVNTALSV